MISTPIPLSRFERELNQVIRNLESGVVRDPIILLNEYHGVMSF